MLTEEEKETLLVIARNSIEAAVRKTQNILPSHQTPHLEEKCGAFVTLHSHGELRGCIGYIEGIIPLMETVQEAAVKAALEDPRFDPVNVDELENIDLEISVLSPLKKINDVNKIEVGKHGLVIKRGYSRGLLLPQVAVEYNWDRETFLNQTCRKAGIGADKWKDPATEIFIFSADIFGEKK